MLLRATLLALAGLAAVVRADDAAFLQNALSHAYLSSAFYSNALARFTSQDFVDADYLDWVRRRVIQINQHAATHQSTLQGLLASSSAASAIPSACDYTFTFSNPNAFLTAAATLEQLASSAYLTALPSLSTAVQHSVGAVMLNRARHSAWLDSAVLRGAAWSGSEETLVPEGAEWDAVWSWVGANGWVDRCPADDPSLPLTAFGKLEVAGNGTLKAGGAVTLDFSASSGMENVALFEGTSVTVLSLSSNSFTLPQDAQGTTYAFITSASTAEDVSAKTILAGPAVLRVGLRSDEVSV